MLSGIAALYRPAPFITPLAKEEASRRYPIYRRRMMASVFCGYGACEDYARVFPLPRWQELSEKLYGLADEVAKALAK